MSIKKIEQTKVNKLFRPLDLVVYGIILTVAAVLLAVNIFTPQKASLCDDKAVAEISSRGEIVFTFDFGSGRYEDGGRVTVTEDGAVYVTVYTDEEKTEYNVVVFDTADGGSIKVASANCSRRHDCTYMSITASGGSIACIPHGLTVYIKSAVLPPISG